VYNEILKIFKKLLQIVVIVLLVIFVESSSTVKENKILNDNYNKSIDLSTMVLKLKEDIQNDLYSSKDTYTGDLTGYVADCPLCTGHLSCLPNYDVLNGNITYQDISYGNVRIVASSSNLACGTIIRFSRQSISSDPVIAIVLDRGVLGNDIDLLSSDLTYATSSVGRSTITYDVLRNGWQ
jgi:hypothetical protein